ncbi:MAG: hypothetical protein H7A35_09400 [Planctomycetales bacterium]|nr:hypothetical protein [bacterium]UNM07093.1 MAG: hypothetical protein H7A35_09400 [Planctomycetales bacterium]
MKKDMDSMLARAGAEQAPQPDVRAAVMARINTGQQTGSDRIWQLAGVLSLCIGLGSMLLAIPLLNGFGSPLAELAMVALGR